ncbi:MAG: ImmA/IrrE family metallo-endopeptidase [Firmicutes bacterium]|nr:ImmA/IrrE family metallo-endopeptidase [Bacillota bacterium]
MSSYINIEALAQDTLRDFSGAPVDDPADIHPLDVDRFAKSFLGLSFAYGHFPDEGVTLGLTAFTDTQVALSWKYRPLHYPDEIVLVPKDTILLDDRLKPPFHNPAWETARRRYVIVHECAHQILFRLEPSDRQQAMRRQFSNRVCSLRELSPAEGLDEWRANQLTAALLMPKKYIDLLAQRYARDRRLVAYGGRLNLPDSLALTHIRGRLGVSRSAAIIRLRQLGHLVDRPADWYHDPAEVSCDVPI